LVERANEDIYVAQRDRELLEKLQGQWTELRASPELDGTVSARAGSFPEKNARALIEINLPRV
jgi:hypothetical protein